MPQESVVLSVQPAHGFERLASIFADPNKAVQLAKRAEGSQWLEPTSQQ